MTRAAGGTWLVLLLLGTIPGALAQGEPPAATAPVVLDVVKAARGVVGPPRGPALSGAALEEATARVADLLRCPVCQGLSVGDSPANMAQDMRAQVKELLAAGFEDEQVLAYFEASYGEFVRLKPAFRGVNRVVWLAPLGGLVLGLAVVVFALRRKAAATAPPAPVPEAAEDAYGLPEDPQLAACVLRVRELAYGWPGGVPPEAARTPETP
jgi:cytochrome c-type biogenesis protein CcmH